MNANRIKKLEEVFGAALDNSDYEIDVQLDEETGETVATYYKDGKQIPYAPPPAIFGNKDIEVIVEYTGGD